MSLLNPGGLRSAPFSRIFGHGEIKRAIQSMKPDHARRAHTSIAPVNRHGGPHLNKREIARRARQAR